MNKIERSYAIIEGTAESYMSGECNFQPRHSLKRLADELYHPLSNRLRLPFKPKPHHIDNIPPLDRWDNEGGRLREEENFTN